MLARGVNIIVRDDHHIQFGLDATRSGVLHTPLAHELARALRTLATPLHRSIATEALIAHTGQSKLEVRSLIDELIAFNVLIAPNAHTVYCVGSSPLAKEIKSLLHAQGFSVRQPAVDESDAAFLSQIDPIHPVVIVDKLAHSRTLGATAARLAPNAVPVASFDSRALIGPVRAGGHGPCLLCLQLELSAYDSMWHQVSQALPEGPSRVDPTLAALIAGEVATMIRRMGEEQIPPGITATRPKPGDYVLIDPFVEPARSTGTMPVHSSCPVCLRARQARGIG